MSCIRGVAIQQSVSGIKQLVLVGITPPHHGFIGTTYTGRNEEVGSIIIFSTMTVFTPDGSSVKLVFLYSKVKYSEDLISGRPISRKSRYPDKNPSGYGIGGPYRVAIKVA